MFTNICMFLIYLLIINIIFLILFIYDKYHSIKSKRRIKESTLHILEFLGSTPASIVLMMLINHKRNKPKYYLKTYSILLFQLLFIYIFHTQLNFTLFNINM